MISDKNEDLRTNFMKGINTLEINISKSLDKKVNSIEFTNLMTTKADFATTTNSLSSKVNFM